MRPITESCCVLLLTAFASCAGAEQLAAKTDEKKPDSSAGAHSAGFVVEEAAGVERPGWPITFGMPFAPGQLKNADTIGIQTASGKALPQAHRIAAIWRDGSVKWLHIDCQADLTKSAKQDFKVVWGQNTSTAKAPSDLRVTKNADGVAIDTGAITFSLSSTGGGVPENVRLSGGELLYKSGTHALAFVESAPPPNTPEMRGNWKRPIPENAKPIVLSANGTKATISVEQQSPLCATVLVSGWYEGGGRKACRFDVRVTAFAGKPYLKIQHTLTFTEDPEKFFVCALNYGFGFEGATKAQFGGEGSTVHEANVSSLAKGCYLLAVGPEINHNGITLAAASQKTVTYEYVDSGEASSAAVISTGKHKDPAGWLAVQSEKAGLAVAVRDFRHLHPKELSADAHGVNVGLWAPHAKLLIDARNPLYGQRIRGETTLEGCACGWAKTHEIWVAFHAPQGRARALDAVRAGQEPAYGIPDPVQVCASGTLGLLAPVDRKNFPGMERQNDTYWAWLARNADVFHWDGFFNYGSVLIEFNNHGERYSNGPAETWCWRDYAGWLLNDGQLAHSAWRAFARSGDRRLLKMAENLSRNIGDESTVHYFNPAVPHAHPLGGAHRHDMSPWGAVVTSYGMDAAGNCDLWYLLGDLRARDVLRDYAANLSASSPGLRESHGPGVILCRIGEALGDPALIETAKKFFKGDAAQCLNPGFRHWTDFYEPLLLALDIVPDDELKKDLLSICDNIASQSRPIEASYTDHPAEILAWAYLQTHEKKYIDTLAAHLTNWNLSGAIAHAGDPWSEDWPLLRKRMDETPHGAVKVYINLLRIGRYPVAIRALQAAGMTEKQALGK